MSDNYISDTTRVFASSDVFFDHLKIDIQQARKSVSIQCMSFEADKVGRKLIELLQSKPTIERTLLIDSYSKYVVNDTFVFGPVGLLNINNTMRERLALNPLLREARASGIKIQFTNPMGFLLHKYPVRNHKKLVLIDDEISYLGGLNFTEHNFRWTDLMIRHSNPEIAQALKTSFEADLHGKEISPIQPISDETTLFVLNGLKTRNAYQKLLSLISNAEKVVAISPYISYPLLDALAKVPDNTVILPERNNKAYIHLAHRLKRYKNINYEFARGEMVHMKLLIIDDLTLLYGSSNFDTISYLFEKEVILKNSDPKLVQQLKELAASLINH
ncbi:MAG: phospholipase D-like domain-containing protein [Balneolaceae bacterium]